MKLEFDIYEFLRRQLPYHKRQPNRMKLFNWTLNQITVVWNQFTAWRTEMIYEINVTGQTMSLVDLLNRRVANANNAISISEKNDGGIYIGKLVEAADMIYLSKLSEGTDFSEMPLDGEIEIDLAVDFQVLAPAGVNPDEINDILSRYVIAGKSYEIIT